jgi:hypothetical protein
VEQIAGHCAVVGLYNVWAWVEGGCCGRAVMAVGRFVVRDFSGLKARELVMNVSAPSCSLTLCVMPPPLFPRSKGRVLSVGLCVQPVVLKSRRDQR